MTSFDFGNNLPINRGNVYMYCTLTKPHNTIALHIETLIYIIIKQVGQKSTDIHHYIDKTPSNPISRGSKFGESKETELTGIVGYFLDIM